MSDRMTDRIKDRLTDHTTDRGTDRTGHTGHPDHTGHTDHTGHPDHVGHVGHADHAPVGHTDDGTGTGGWGPGGSPDAAVTPVRPLSDPGVPPGADSHDLQDQRDRSAGQGIRDGQVFQDTHGSADGHGTSGTQGTGLQGGGAHDGVPAHSTPYDGAAGAPEDTGAHSPRATPGPQATQSTTGVGNVTGGPFGGVTGTGDDHGTHGRDTYGTGTNGTGTHGTGTHGTGTHGTGTHHTGARHADDGPGETLHRLLPHEDTEKQAQRLHHAMGGFVDEPRGSVAEAEKILDEVSERLSSCLTARRRTLRTAWQSLGDETADPSADTEQLRLILRDYRELTERLLRL
ncbi:hypothetical protein [Streptomyces abyssomicinicus]|uniref:hypothetical protein n=1 Tax=Streptomyces abyssomicinicus TaxID=574929 RepID=UPI00125044B1|nr:hypothetical protein [Streptomyces abyssomicinicus]